MSLRSSVLPASALQAKYEWRAPFASKGKLKSDQVTLMRARMAGLAHGAQQAGAGGTLQAEHTARLIEGVGWLAPRSGPQGVQSFQGWQQAWAMHIVVPRCLALCASKARSLSPKPVCVLVAAGVRGRGAWPHSEACGGQAAPGTCAAADWQWLPPGHLDLPLTSPDMWSAPSSSPQTGQHCLIALRPQHCVASKL